VLVGFRCLGERELVGTMKDGFARPVAMRSQRKRLYFFTLV